MNTSKQQNQKSSQSSNNGSIKPLLVRTPTVDIVPELVLKAIKLLKGKLVIIEGGIAVGKSTACKTMKKYLSGDYPVINQEESSDTKTYSIDNDIVLEYFPPEWLSKYLEDMDKNVQEFQTNLYRKRYNEWIESQCECDKGTLVMIDRSFMIGDEAFMLMQTEEYKRLNTKQINEIRSIADMSKIRDPDLIIYLSVTGETSLKRVKKRSTDGEISSYTLDYLSKVIEKHEKVIKKKKSELPIIGLDWNAERTERDIFLSLITPMLKYFESLVKT